MAILVLVLMIIATVLFGIETFRSRSLIAGGLFCWALAVTLPLLLGL